MGTSWRCCMALTVRRPIPNASVDISEFQIFDAAAFRTRRDGEDLDLVGFAFFTDPDGNRWGVQQMSARA